MLPDEAAGEQRVDIRGTGFSMNERQLVWGA